MSVAVRLSRLSGFVVLLAAVYRTVWQQAANRATCALIAPYALPSGAGAVAPPASFSDVGAVAYDKPGLRSAFGVAGTGSKASGVVRVFRRAKAAPPA